MGWGWNGEVDCGGAELVNLDGEDCTMVLVVGATDLEADSDACESLVVLCDVAVKEFELLLLKLFSSW